MRKRAPTTAMVRGDHRPFLVRAIDRALELGRWNAVDVDQFTIDVVNMTFRYLRRYKFDIRDLDAVRNAATIVLMYIADGLEEFSGSDIETAASLLATCDRILSDAFRMARGRIEQVRATVIDTEEQRVVYIGGRSHDAVVLPALPIGLSCVEDRPVSAFTDSFLAEHYRAAGSIRSVRSDLEALVVKMREHLSALHALPIRSLHNRWTRILGSSNDQLRLGMEQRSAYDYCWTSVCVSALVRRDVALTVRTDDVIVFMRDHVTCDEGRMIVRGESLAAATAFLTERLTPTCGTAAARIPEALSDAAIAIGVVCDEVRNGRLEPHSGAWCIAWGLNAVFLELTDAEHDVVYASLAERVTDPDEIVAQFDVVAGVEARRRLLETLDLARFPITHCAQLLATNSTLVPTIVARMALAARSAHEIETLLAEELPDRVGRVVAETIVDESSNLASCEPATAIGFLKHGLLGEHVVTLLDRMHITPEVLLEQFRGAGNHDDRVWWVQLAAASHAHFIFLLHDAESYPAEMGAIRALFHGSITDLVDRKPWASPAMIIDLLIACERDAASRARRAFRSPFPAKGPPRFRSEDATFVWTAVKSDTHRDLRNGFARKFREEQDANAPAQKRRGVGAVTRGSRRSSKASKRKKRSP